MSSFVRTSVAVQTYRDADGAVIEYGTRWGSDGPPSDSHSVESHPERFAPMHQIADAVIDYLLDNYDVEVSDDLSCARDVRHEVEAVRAVRLTPATDDAAPLTFVFTRYPGLIVHAGLLHDFLYPVCGCDACDNSLASWPTSWNGMCRLSCAADTARRSVAACVNRGSGISSRRRTARALLVAAAMRPLMPAHAFKQPLHA